MSVRNLLTGLFQGFIGRLSDIFGRKFILGLLISIPLIFFESTWLLIAVAILQAFSVSVVTPSWNAVLGDVTETLGAFSGLAQASWGIATFIGSLGAGFIADAINSAYGAIIMVISTTIAIAIMRVLASIGYFFIKESLPKENRTSKTTN